MLKISEQFYSIQGEGKTMGVPAFFLRLAGCNLLCGGKGTDKDGELHGSATWRCDTIEVWQKGMVYTLETIVKQFLKCPPETHLIITGGEPLMQQSRIIELIYKLEVSKRFVEIETNGTLVPHQSLLARVDQWNISPKLSNSGMLKQHRIKLDAMKKLAKVNSQFKFVISSEADLAEALTTIVEPFGISPQQIWLMPAGSNRLELDQTAPLTAELAKKHGFNYSHRLHITLWNQKTGV